MMAQARCILCYDGALRGHLRHEGPMTRREKFRAYMARVAAAADPALAIEQQLYVHPPGAISDLIVARFEIDPGARHLVVGGVGSGKTTQLVTAKNRLNALGDLHAEYLDVSEKQDLRKVRPGCLIALAGGLLRGLLGAEAPKGFAWEPFMKWVDGSWGLELLGGMLVGRGLGGLVPGVVSSPQHDWDDIPNEHVMTVSKAHAQFSRRGRTLAVLFDALDRMTDHEAFARVVEQDIAALRKAGIGVVLVGPIRSLAGFGRLDADRFDYLHFQTPIDAAQDAEGRQFLMEVLEKRAGEGMLSEDAASRLIFFSGGVLRDLISLAKAAGDEAYLRGADSIGVEHVHTAADAYGRALMIGLKQEEIATLRHLQSTGGFVRTSEGDLALIATRRILEYRGSTIRYAVHPVIGELLGQLQPTGRT